MTSKKYGKSKKKKASKKDLNKKGSEKEGSEMDMFTNIDKAQAQVPPEKTTRTEKITQSNSSQNVSVNANTNNRSKSNSSQKNVSDVKENVNSAVDSKEKFTNIPSTSPVPNVSQADKNNKTDDRNADGSKCTKKRYTVNFMLNLRDEPQCKVKVQLECNSALLFPSVGGGGRSSQNGCFLPAFAAPNHPQNVSSLPTRKSTSIGRRDKPNQIHYSLSLREEVPLRRAKDAWKPAIFSQDAKNLSDEEKKSEALYKSVRGILNKLTPEKFPALIVKFKALEIDTAPRLREVIKLIFQKAIDEPGFCKWYAEMCQEMQHLTLPEETGEKPISFRILLLNQCQAQFERDKAAELDSVTKKSEIDACTNPEKKKELQLLFEENERKNRRKSVGNCRFIGELFKHKMLTSKIMMNCIRQLLTQIEEESLECLCKLLTTIGKDLDTKAPGTQSSKELDPFFKKMQDIAEKKTYKVSSRIRFMLLDVIELRRNHWVPRRETDNPKTIGEMNSEMEKKEYEQKMQAAIATRKSYDDYGNRGRDNKRNRNDRQSNDEWQTVTKSNMAKPNYKLDPSKFSSLTQSSQDTEASLGPPSFNVWRSGAGASVKSSDKKSMSSSMHVPDRLSVTSSRGSSSGKLTPSTSMERSKPFPASRETDALKMSRSGSVQNVHPVSRESSVPRAAPPRTASQTAAPPPSNVPTELSEEELKRCSATILKEYYVSKDLEDSLAAFAERFNPNQVTKVFEEFIYMVLEDPKLAEPCGKLTAALLKKKSVSLSHIISALSRIIEAAGDIVIDYPRMWEYITDMLSVIFIQDCLQYNEFEAALLKQHPNECDHALLSAVKTKLMDSRANATSNESSLADTSDQNHIYKFLLEKLTNDAFESTSKWIDENFGNSRHNSEVVVAITEAVCEILYQKINTNRDFQKEVDDAFSKKFRNLFKKYIENEEKLEIDCLKTIERFAKKNQFPNGFLLKLFMALYESKSISHESFVQWKTMKGEAEHGVAVSSLRTFYEYLAEEREPQLNTNESS